MGVFSKPTAKGGKSLRWYVSFSGLDGRRRKIVAGDTKPAAEKKLREYERLRATYPRTLHEELKHLSVPEAIGVLKELGASVEQRNAVLGRIRLLAPKSTDKTMADLAAMWLAYGRDKRSLKDDEQRFTEIIRFFGADTPVALITAERVEAFRDALLEGGAEAAEGEDRRRRKDKLTPATVNRYLQTLRGAIRLAEKRHYQTARPFEGVSMLAEDNERNRLPTDEELERILDAAKGELRLLIILARWTAMRASEILGLEWKRVDLKNATVRLEASHTKGKRIRDVPLPAAAVEALKAWPRRIDTQNLFERNIATMSPAFGKLCASLGIEDLHLHDLRHFRLTELRRAGADLFVLQQISGHRTLEMLRRYSHVSLDEMRRAVEAAERP